MIPSLYAVHIHIKLEVPLEMDIDTQVQILYKTFYISHNTDTLGKGMNQTIFPSTMGKYWGRLGTLTLVWQLD